MTKRNPDTGNIVAAAFAGDVEKIERLLAAGTSPDAHNRFGHTPLRFALLGRQRAAAEFLVGKNADVNLASNMGVSPLMVAAQVGDIWAIELLLKKGARFGDRDKNGWAALDYAKRYNKPQAVAALEAEAVHWRAQEQARILKMRAAQFKIRKPPHRPGGF